jgi:hypothetical protein
MSEKTNISLFFIKSPQAKLAPIETFLKKRNYHVTIESDLKECLVKIIETQPDFVFIALDHPNSKVSSIHQIIEQSILTKIIHYVYSSAKEDVRKLNYGQFNQKMFPPISGPAIERLVLKFVKEKERENQQDARDTENQQKKESSVKNKEEMIQIKSKAMKNLDSIDEEDHEAANSWTEIEKNAGVIIQKGLPHKTKIKAHNSFLEKTEQKKLTAQQKNELQKNFESKIKTDLLDVLETYFPDHSQMTEIDSLELDQSARFTQIEQNNSKAFCLPIQTEIWCGYLLAYSNVSIEYQLIEPIFKNWLSEFFVDLTDEESSQSTELEIEPQSFKSWVQTHAEHSERLSLNRVEILIGFIGIEPSEFKLKIVDEHDLIEIDLELIPVESDLSLSLHLHLPDNKKFLLYTPLNQKLSLLQKQRLIDKKVDKLFTPIEFEKELRKLKTRNHVTQLFESFKKETSV